MLFLAYSIGLIASDQITIHELLSNTLNIFEMFYPFVLQPSTNAWWWCSRMAEPKHHPPFPPCEPPEPREAREPNGCHALWWSSCASFISHSWMNSQSCEVGFDHPGSAGGSGKPSASFGVGSFKGALGGWENMGTMVVLGSPSKRWGWNSCFGEWKGIDRMDSPVNSDVRDGLVREIIPKW